jgi:hypothetical protein
MNGKLNNEVSQEEGWINLDICHVVELFFNSMVNERNGHGAGFAFSGHIVIQQI